MLHFATDPRQAWPPAQAAADSCCSTPLHGWHCDPYSTTAASEAPTQTTPAREERSVAFFPSFCQAFYQACCQA